MERVAMADTQPLLLGGGSWQGWELMEMTPSWRRSNHRLAEHVAMLKYLFRAVFRHRSLCKRRVVRLHPGLGWAGSKRRQQKKRHLFRFYIIPKQPVPARFPNFPGAKQGREPGPSRSPAWAVAGVPGEDGCREAVGPCFSSSSVSSPCPWQE